VQLGDYVLARESVTCACSYEVRIQLIVSGALRGLLLRRRAVEKEFRVDMSLGDVNFETSSDQRCPTRTRVDTTLDGRSYLLPQSGRG
jgi:hypothetical protein